MKEKINTTFELIRQDDGTGLIRISSNGEIYRLTVRAMPIKESVTPPRPSLPMWECPLCDRFRVRPDAKYAMPNHLVRLHGLDADGEEVAAARARARELLKDPGWRDQLKREEQYGELVRRADALRLRALREQDDLGKAREFHARANALEAEAKTLR